MFWLWRKLNADVFPQLVYISDFLFVLAIYIAKFAVALFFNRLSSRQDHIRQANAIMVACGACGVASLLVVAVRQPYILPWSSVMQPNMVFPNIRDSSWDRANVEQLNSWIIIEVLSNVLDIALVGFPIHLILRLQMDTAKKFKIVAGFAFRLP